MSLQGLVICSCSSVRPKRGKGDSSLLESGVTSDLGTIIYCLNFYPASVTPVQSPVLTTPVCVTPVLITPAGVTPVLATLFQPDSCARYTCVCLRLHSRVPSILEQRVHRDPTLEGRRLVAVRVEVLASARVSSNLSSAGY